MRWFKHMTNSSDGQFMAELEDRFGWEGYGRWFKLLEKIGQVMGGDNGCSAIYPWADWQRFLKGKRNKLVSFLVHLENKRKINLKQNGNILEIECPKLLEIKDEYSKKSGQTPKNIRPKSTEDRVQSTEKECGEEAPPPPTDLSKLSRTKPNGNGHKSPSTIGPEAMQRDQWAAEANQFLDHAQASHLEIRGSPLVLAKRDQDVERVAQWIAVDGLPAEVLGVCWDFFLRDKDPWLVGRARNLAIFGSRLNDYLEKTRASEQAEARRIQERGPVPKINPDPEAGVLWEKCLKWLGSPESKILPDNFETWFAPTVGLVMTRGRVVIGVPGRFYVKCLAGNYSREIKAALFLQGISPAPKLEFIHEYELTDA